MIHFLCGYILCLTTLPIVWHLNGFRLVADIDNDEDCLFLVMFLENKHILVRPGLNRTLAQSGMVVVEFYQFLVFLVNLRLGSPIDRDVLEEVNGLRIAYFL